MNDKINLEKAREEFKRYVSEFNLEENMISLKYAHSFRVAETSKELGTYVRDNIDGSVNVELAELIGLLHDIGRFEQFKRYGVCEDRDTLDHALLGVQILKENDYIYKFCPIEHLQDTMLIAIYYHNKFSLPDGYEGPNMVQSRIIRDSDKLDILQYTREIPFNTISGKDEIRNQYISDVVFNQIMRGTQIMSTDLSNDMDEWIKMISFVYDLYYPRSFEILKTEGYIDTLLDRVNSAHNHVKIEEIRKSVNDYIDSKIGGIQE